MSFEIGHSITAFFSHISQKLLKNSVNYKRWALHKMSYNSSTFCAEEGDFVQDRISLFFKSVTEFAWNFIKYIFYYKVTEGFE
jgi:hypothetical protein